MSVMRIPCDAKSRGALKTTAAACAAATVAGVLGLSVPAADAATVLVTGTNVDKVLSYEVSGKTWTLNGTFADPATDLGGGAALDAPAPLAFDGGNVYVGEQKAGGRILRFTAGGAFAGVVATEGVEFTGNPDAMAVGPDGQLYMSVAFGTSSDKVYRINPATGAATTFADTTNTSAAGTYTFNNPRGIAFDDAGVLYVADRQGGQVRKFDSAGVFLGNLAAFNTPQSVSYDAANNRLLVGSQSSNGNGLVLGFQKDGTSLGELVRLTTGNGFLDLENIGGEVFFTHFAGDVVRVDDDPATGAGNTTSSVVAPLAPDSLTDLDGVSHMQVIPEPGGIVLATLACVGLLARRRRGRLVPGTSGDFGRTCADPTRKL